MKRCQPSNVRISLIAALAATSGAILLLACGEDFTSCTARRDCAPTNGGNTGDKGDSGAGGEPGNDGTPDAGRGGNGSDAGAGGDSAIAGALQLIAARPGDGDVDVERTPEVRLRFSEPLEAASVTSESVVLEDRNGPVEADVSVEGVEVTLIPARPLSLFAQYEIVVTPEVRAQSGAVLPKRLAVGFRVRDGVLGASQQLDSGEVNDLQIKSASSDHSVAVWTNIASSKHVRAAFYDAELGAWTAARNVDAQPSAYTSSVSINDNGDVVVSYLSEGGGVGSNRFTRARGWASPRVESIEGAMSIANDGTLLRVRQDFDAMTILYSVLPPRSSTWSPEALLQSGVGYPFLISGHEHFIATFQVAGTANFLAQILRFTPDPTWSSPFVLSDSGSNFYTLGVGRNGHAGSIWFTELGELGVWAAFSDWESWKSPQEIAKGSKLAFPSMAMNSYGETIAAWVDGAEIRAARGNEESGWLPAETLGRSILGAASQPQVAIDDSGNTFVVWAIEGRVHWRRSGSDGVWQDEFELPDIVASYAKVVTTATGDSNLLWFDAFGIWTAQFD